MIPKDESKTRPVPMPEGLSPQSSGKRDTEKASSPENKDRALGSRKQETSPHSSGISRTPLEAPSLVLRSH